MNFTDRFTTDDFCVTSLSVSVWIQQVKSVLQSNQSTEKLCTSHKPHPAGPLSRKVCKIPWKNSNMTWNTRPKAVLINISKWIKAIKHDSRTCLRRCGSDTSSEVFTGNDKSVPTNILINLNTLASSQALAWKQSLLYNDHLGRAYC